jgi:hypothetical protein
MVQFTTSSGQVVDRWDWLELGPELAEEASVFGNADGSKFYAVWNQELEIGEEVYTNMDTEFRRIFYNLTEIDADPSATILGDLPAEVEEGSDEILTFIGTGRDNDRMGEGGQYGRGVDGYRWFSSLNGLLNEGQVFEIPVKDLIKGLHTIYFSVLDDEGNWSAPDTVTIGVGVPNQPGRIFLPIIIR